MRVLYLTNGFPYPLTSGYLRHYFLIRHLSGSHRVTLFSVTGSGFLAEHADALKPFVERLRTFSAAHRGGTRLRKLAHRIAHPQANAEISAMRAAVREELEQRSYDVVMLSGKNTFAAIAGLRRLPPVVADMCDATSARLQRQSQHAPLPRRLWLRYDTRRTARVEHRIVSCAQHVVFASSRDREAVVGSSPRASVLPNGVDTRFWKRREPLLGVDTIVFTGAMNYAPNADAALVLAREILPLVRTIIPSARLLLVGHSPGRDVLALRDIAGVTVTGFVDDVRPYLDQATVFAAPLRFGAGIQNKLLEALSMELPAVVTPLAEEGLRTEHDDRPPVDTAGTPGAVAAAIARRLIDGGRLRGPDCGGRTHVGRHLSWGASGGKGERILATTARGRVA